MTLRIRLICCTENLVAAVRFDPVRSTQDSFAARSHSGLILQLKCASREFGAESENKFRSITRGLEVNKIRPKVNFFC
jgi:hypothetical protein